jgi:hypothetical protein
MYEAFNRAKQMWGGKDQFTPREGSPLGPVEQAPLPEVQELPSATKPYNPADTDRLPQERNIGPEKGDGNYETPKVEEAPLPMGVSEGDGPSIGTPRPLPQPQEQAPKVEEPKAEAQPNPSMNLGVSEDDGPSIGTPKPPFTPLTGDGSTYNVKPQTFSPALANMDKASISQGSNTSGIDVPPALANADAENYNRLMSLKTPDNSGDVEAYDKNAWMITRSL